MLDDINVTYVAFTRPVERLDVILELEKMEFDEPKNMSQLVVWSLQKVYNSDVAPGNQTVAFSARQEVSEDTALSISQTPKSLITGESINQLVVVSENEENPTQPEGLNPREIGTEVHRLLEEINCKEDWAEIKKRYELGMNVGAKDRSVIVERVEAVLNSPDCMRYFDEDLHVETEQRFISSEGQVLRPDRIVKTGDAWTVIDYKSSEQGSKKHQNQIKSYCEILSEIEGPNVEGIIIYTDPLKVLKVV